MWYEYYIFFFFFREEESFVCDFLILVKSQEFKQYNRKVQVSFWELYSLMSIK